MITARGRSTSVLVATLMSALLSCDSSDPSGQSGPKSTSTTAAPATTSSVVAPATTARPGPPVTRGPKAITFGPITFHTPSDWDKVEAGGTTAYIGVLAGGKGDVNLRVTTDYTGTIDALQPEECLGHDSIEPTRVDLVESGFAPVGSLTAEYRRWHLTCPRGDVGDESHRVWLLPVSRIAVVEQRHAPEVLDVVTTAEVA